MISLIARWNNLDIDSAPVEALEIARTELLKEIQSLELKMGPKSPHHIRNSVLPTHTKLKARYHEIIGAIKQRYPAQTVTRKRRDTFIAMLITSDYGPEDILDMDGDALDEIWENASQAADRLLNCQAAKLDAEKPWD